MRTPCDRVPYDTSEAAKSALAHVRTRRGQKRRTNERSTYKCRRCKKWHLTSHPS